MKPIALDIMAAVLCCDLDLQPKCQIWSENEDEKVFCYHHCFERPSKCKRWSVPTTSAPSETPTMNLTGLSDVVAAGRYAHPHSVPEQQQSFNFEFLRLTGRADPVRRLAARRSGMLWRGFKCHRAGRINNQFRCYTSTISQYAWFGAPKCGVVRDHTIANFPTKD